MVSPALETVLTDHSRTPSTPTSLRKDGSFVQSTDGEGKANLAPAAKEPPRCIDLLFRRNNAKPVDLDAIATEVSVFDDPILAPHFQPSSEYENLHRFDPSARWTYREERAVIRKIDWRIMLWAAIAFSALNLDKGSLSHANSDNILKDLGLSTDDFNLGNSVFRLAFLFSELPSQLISKGLGPDRWIPIQMCLWSITTSAQFWLSGRTSFLVCRALLGLIQGGFIPDLILYLSYFYKKTELPLRLVYFAGSSNICAVVSSFLAFGILRMRGVQGKAGWRWLFLIEGLLTLVIGIATFFQMPPSPTQSKAWFRPKGWFTEREEVIMVNRVLRDDPTKSDMHNRQRLNIKDIWKGALNFDLYPIYILGLMLGIPPAPPSTYLTLSLKNLGFSTLRINLLTIPPSIAGLIPLIGTALLSEAFGSRALVLLIADVWVIPCLIALYTLPVNLNPWVYYTVASVLISHPFTHSIRAAWASRNAGGVANRTINASLYNMCFQASSVVSAFIYRADDAPRYRRGNLTLIIIAVVNTLILYPGTWFYYKWRNAQRDKMWNAMNDQEKSDYLSTTKDVGNQRLDFRFAY